MHKKITLIGSTGSIGRQVLQVVEAHSDKFKIVAMAANSSAKLFAQQVHKVQPESAVLRAEQAEQVESSVKIAYGEQAFEDICRYPCDIVIVAATGFAGLKATLLAIEAGHTVALANKESLVVAGDLVLAKAREKGVQILPIDSEHSAIWQALNFQTVLTAQKSFSKLILTASGGALRDFSIEKLQTVTAQEALAHPTWNMGSKITIDCATMLNKGYEVIEAMHLFGASLQQIEVVLHRESIVHSMVEFVDGGIIAQLGMPSMELPIQLALSYPERLQGRTECIDWRKLHALHFESMQTQQAKERYPCFTLAMHAAKSGGLYPLVLNAWAEIAVNSFLNCKIAYTTIAQMIEKGLTEFVANDSIKSYKQLEELDREERTKALRAID